MDERKFRRGLLACFEHFEMRDGSSRCAENIALGCSFILEYNYIYGQPSISTELGCFGRLRTQRGGKGRRTGARIDVMDASSFRRRRMRSSARARRHEARANLALRRWSRLAVSARVVTVRSTTRWERTCVVAHAWRPSPS